MSTTSRNAYVMNLAAIFDIASSSDDIRYLCDTARNEKLCGHCQQDYYGTYAVYCEICPFSSNNFDADIFAALYADEMERQGKL